MGKRVKKREKLDSEDIWKVPDIDWKPLDIDWSIPDLNFSEPVSWPEAIDWPGLDGNLKSEDNGKT